MRFEREKIAYKVGLRIRDFRTKQKISQEELAFLSGIHPAYLGHIERGDKCPTIDTLNKVCNGLKISMSQLLDFDVEISPTNQEALQRIEKVIADMPADKAVELAEIVERIANMNK